MGNVGLLHTYQHWNISFKMQVHTHHEDNSVNKTAFCGNESTFQHGKTIELNWTLEQNTLPLKHTFRCVAWCPLQLLRSTKNIDHPWLCCHQAAEFRILFFVCGREVSFISRVHTQAGATAPPPGSFCYDHSVPGSTSTSPIRSPLEGNRNKLETNKLFSSLNISYNIQPKHVLILGLLKFTKMCDSDV